jgi:hypothetical protein
MLFRVKAQEFILISGGASVQSEMHADANRLALFTLRFPTNAGAEVREPWVGPNASRELKAGLEKRSHHRVAFMDRYSCEFECVVEFPRRGRCRGEHQWLNELAHRACKRLFVQAACARHVADLVVDGG